MEVYSPKYGKITLADVAFSSGGEGEVRKVISPPAGLYNVCVKVYYKSKRTPERENKIKFMVQNPPQQVQNNSFLIGWPLDYVTDDSGQFLGFIMPLAFADSRQLTTITTPKMPKNLAKVWYDNYDRAQGKRSLINRLKLINNIAIPIHYLHSTGKYVLRDFKPENVLFTADGKITIVDMDSVQICEGSRLLFAGTTATPNYMPPEYYMKGVGKHPTHVLKKSWDGFAMSVVFYQVLFGLHPYVVTPHVQHDANCADIYQNIADNLFPFGPNRHKVASYPAPHKKFEVLPEELKQLFLRSFTDNAVLRPEAADWGKIVHKHVVAAGPVPAPQPVPVPSPSPTPTPTPSPSPKPTPTPPPGPKPTPAPPPGPKPAGKTGPDTQPEFWDSMFSFSGRYRRTRFWLTSITQSLMGFGTLFLLLFLVEGGNLDPDMAVILYVIVSLILTWMGFANYSKRLHDLGLSGAWNLGLFIPLANLVLFIMMAFVGGERHDNKYGPSPY